MECDRVRLAISGRMDGERLSPRLAAAVEEHIVACAGCAAFRRGAWRLREAARFEVAPEVPDLVDPIMAAVRSQARAGTHARPRLRASRSPGALREPRALREPGTVLPRRPLLPRLARELVPVAAALVVGLVAGSLLVGGPWQRPEGTSVDAAEITAGVAAAATRLSSYQASFSVTERGFAPDVPVRELSMNVWFQAPERFRLDVTDHTRYPSKDFTPTDLELIVNGLAWYSVGPSPCPVGICPKTQTVVESRVPFSSTTPAPTDLILPISTLAGTDRLQVVGGGTVLGRDAVEVRLPFDRAQPLFPFLSLGGSWRPFFPKDRVELWLDAKSWFPLKYTVYPAAGHERDQWELRFGLPEEPPRTPIFEVAALSVDEGAPAPGTFRIPNTRGTKDGGARTVPIADVSKETGFEPVTPGQTGGLDLYTVVLPPAAKPQEKPEETLITYSKGLTYLKVGETRAWKGDTLYGPVGPHAQEVILPNGGVAYFEPATEEHGRRLSIHAAGTDLFLETNLSREELLAVAGSLPVTGMPIPEAWRIRTSADGITERVLIEQAAADVPFALSLPSEAGLPAGYAFASAELVLLSDSTSVNVYFQQVSADFGTGVIRLHMEAASELPPASSAVQSEIEIRGQVGRWTPERRQLEWVENGVYYSLDAPGLELSDLLAVAESLTPFVPPPVTATPSPPVSPVSSPATPTPPASPPATQTPAGASP